MPVVFEHIPKGKTDWTIPVNANFDAAKKAIEEIEAKTPIGPSEGGAIYFEFITPTDGWQETEDGYQKLNTGLLVDDNASLLISANISDVSQILSEISIQAVNEEGTVFLVASGIPESISLGITLIKIEKEIENEI